MNRLGLAFLGQPAVPEMVRAARYAEGLCYESVWVAETRFARDGFVPAAAIAAVTERIKIRTKFPRKRASRGRCRVSGRLE